MARGNVQTIPTGTQTLQRTLNAEVRSAIRVLNPNDGIVYVAINGQASPVTFDFVVPSQSYAALPGPWMEYGLYFLDQSGAGRSGVVTVYESDDTLDFPDYHAIGRSLQAQVNTLDITEGPQPPAPAIGVDRLWTDNQGHVYSLLSDGTLRELAPLFGGKGGLLQLTDLLGVPATGKGLELFGYQPTPAGGIQAVNRDAGGAFIELDIRGNPVRINPSAEGDVYLNLHLYSATGPGSTLTFASSAYLDGPSLVLPQGQYLVGCWFTAINPGTGSVQWNGGIRNAANAFAGPLNTYHSAPANNTDGFGFTMITSLAADTYKMSLQSNTGAGTWYANASFFTALRLQ